MANHSVQTIAEPGSKAKVAAAIVFLIAGIVAFYVLAEKGDLIRTSTLIVCLVVAAVLFLLSTSGRTLVAFSRDAVRETKKVVWPTRKETTQITLAVFGFVLVMSIFLWGTDKSFEYLFYDLILGWKQ